MTRKDLRFRGGFRVRFPLTDVSNYDVVYGGVEIHQRIRQHDTASIRIRSRSINATQAVTSGAPVHITYWGSEGGTGSFVGYVTNIRNMDRDDQGRYVRDVVCVSASRELRRTGFQTYENKTSSEIVQKIAKDLRFNAVIKQHPLRRATIVQDGETYWELMTRLAKRSGYILRVEETTIFFQPLRDMVKTYMSRSPYLTDKGAFSIDGFVPENVESIDAWVGDTSMDEESSADPALITAVEPTTGRAYNVREIPQSALVRGRTSRSGYTRYPSDTVAHSRRDAKILARGAADEGMMAFDASLTVAGNSMIRPYRTVELDIRDGTLNGYWIVKEVRHSIYDGIYKAEVVVSTDSFDGVKRTSARKGGRARRDLSTEQQQGYSPDGIVTSRLRTVGSGFVVGKTGPGGSYGRWVSAR